MNIFEYFKHINEKDEKIKDKMKLMIIQNLQQMKMNQKCEIQNF